MKFFALLFAFVLACALAQPLSGFALEALARKQAAALGHPPAALKEPFTDGEPPLRVTGCSEWPWRKGCESWWAA